MTLETVCNLFSFSLPPRLFTPLISLRLVLFPLQIIPAFQSCISVLFAPDLDSLRNFVIIVEYFGYQECIRRLRGIVLALSSPVTIRAAMTPSLVLWSIANSPLESLHALEALSRFESKIEPDCCRQWLPWWIPLGQP